MRKDSALFLRKLLEHRKEIKKDNFLINYQYFEEIPNLENAIYDILRDLISNNCLTSNSQVTDFDGNININLTLDGITYFEDLEKKNIEESIIFNVSGGQVNIANDNGIIKSVINEKPTDVETLVEPNYKKGVGISSLSSESKEKVFVSYSWTPESNKRWVEQLVNRLETDGVQVVIDFKDLRLGHDKYAFMERIVNDNSIKKVLIICNKTYKEKADNRTGGVGDESAIITSQIYGSVQQEKFIPVVNEYDENGRPFLPNYLASRMYADLTDFERGYSELLCNIVGNKNNKQGMHMIDNQDMEMILNKRESADFKTPNLKIVQNLWTQTPEFKLVNESSAILNNFNQPLFFMSIPSKVYFQNTHSNAVHSLLTLSPISYEVILEQVNTGRTTGDISISKLPSSFKGKMGERDVIRGGIVEETEDLRIWIDTYPFLVIICDILYSYDNSICREIIINTPMGNEYIDEKILGYLLEYFRDNAKYEVQLSSADQSIYYKTNEMVKKLFANIKYNQTFFCKKEGGYGNVLKLLNQIITPYNILEYSMK